MSKALKESKLAPEEIDVLNTHSPGTEAGDLSDYKAILRLFEKHDPKISATKGSTGHGMGMAGMMEAVWTVKMIEEDRIPPTKNTKNPMEVDGRRPNIVKETTKTTVNTAMNFNSGAGGTNAATIFSKLR